VRDWQPIELGEAVATGFERGHYDTMVVYGHLVGGPFAAVVDPGRGVQVLDVPGSGAVSFAAVSEQIELAIEGLPPLHLLEDRLPGSPGKPHGRFEVCGDVDTGDLVRLWPVCGDEDPQVVALDKDGRLRVIDIAVGDPPEGPGLWVAEEDPRSSSILVGQAGMAACVAGLLRGGGLEPGQQLWVSDFYDGWTRLNLEPAPEAFSDIYSGIRAAVAGHRGGFPLLFDEYGTRLETPAVPLQPDHPMVCVLSASDTLVQLALQSAEAGPQLWVGGGGSPWRVEPLPPGRLEAARAHGDNLWLVVGGQVWRSPR
jgi:hypothetical protein